MLPVMSGITPLVDSCAGMIYQQASSTYRRLPKAEQRWLDPEDLIQDGLMTASYQTEAAFRVDGGSKFSTMLSKALYWHYNKEYEAKFAAKKRVSRIVELDKPISETSSMVFASALRSGMASPEVGISAVKSFIQLCSVVSGPAVELLVDGLLFGNWCSNGSKGRLLGEIRQAVEREGINYVDLQALTKDENARKKALTMIGSASRIGLGLEMEAWMLECIRCGGQFGLSALRKSPPEYDVETMTCRKCHLEMKAALPDESCFGKTKTSDHEGYSDADIECRIHCADRKICKQFIGETVMEGTVENVVTGETLPFDEIDRKRATKKTAKKAKSNGHANAEAGKKKAKAKKAAADNGQPRVDYIGGIKKAVDTGVTVGAGTKTAKILQLLKKGATRTEISKASGTWDDHSVRGFICSAPKRYGVVIEVTKVSGKDPVYVITDGFPEVVAEKAKKKAPASKKKK